MEYQRIPHHAIPCNNCLHRWALHLLSLPTIQHGSKSHVSAGGIHYTSAAVTVRDCAAHMVHQICQPGAVGRLDTADGATNNIDSSTLVKLIQIKLYANSRLADP